MIAIIMGVLGAGKTTVGSLLAQQLGWEFVDADSFHSPANIEKMRQGVPLSDSDREPWLDSIRAALLQWAREERNVVLACSALKRRYRDRLEIGTDVKFVYLKASPELILSRLKSRHGHFAGQNLVLSQFAELEEPADALVVDANNSPEQMVDFIRRQL